MRRLWAKRQTGFTIVELLIVVVVIAILAAISIVAYSGIQNRAEASKTVTAVEAYRKALLMYRADNGSYPVTGAMCLGDQYGTFSGDTIPRCRSSTSPINVSANTAPRDSLKQYTGGQLPMPSTKFLHVGTTEYVGAHFYGSTYGYTLDNKPVVAIEYYVTSDTCPVGPVYAPSAPSFTTPAVSRSQALSNGSRCFILLPND